MFHGEATFPHPSLLAWSSPQESWRVGWPRGQGQLHLCSLAQFSHFPFPYMSYGEGEPSLSAPCDVASGGSGSHVEGEKLRGSLSLTCALSTSHPWSAAHGHTGTHAAVQGGGSVCPVLMLLGSAVLQIRPWVCFTCSHHEKSTTSPTSRLKQPVLQKVLPWPHSSSWQQHSRSGQGWLCPLWGGDRPCISQGPGVTCGWVTSQPLSQALFAPSTSIKQESCWVLPGTLGWDL